MTALGCRPGVGDVDGEPEDDEGVGLGPAVPEGENGFGRFFFKSPLFSSASRSENTVTPTAAAAPSVAPRNDTVPTDSLR